MKIESKDLLKEIAFEWRGVNYKELCLVERSLTEDRQAKMMKEELINKMRRKNGIQLPNVDNQSVTE